MTYFSWKKKLLMLKSAYCWVIIKSEKFGNNLNTQLSVDGQDNSMA